MEQKQLHSAKQTELLLVTLRASSKRLQIYTVILQAKSMAK
jgi:hypothetical protein